MTEENPVASYWDSVADRYLKLFRDELQAKPFDCGLLREFADELGAGSLVCDAGCGPCGHITALLSESHLRVVGADISPRCVELARREQPHLRFEQMDLRAMTFAGGELDGVVAYYSLHYEKMPALREMVGEFARVLRPGGRLLIAVKESEDESGLPDPLGSGQSIYWKGFRADGLTELLAGWPFRVDRLQVREPLSGEIAANRIYLLATRL